MEGAPKDNAGAAQTAAELFMGNITNLAETLNDESAETGEREKARAILEGLKSKAESDLSSARESAGFASKDVHEAQAEAVASEEAVLKAINLALGLEENDGF